MSINTQSAAIQISDLASPEVYTAIQGVTDFSGFSGSRAVIDKTALSDTTRQKEVGIADMGQVQVNGIWDADNAQALQTYDAFISGVVQHFKMVFNDSPQEVFSFNAFVLNFSFNTGIDDVVRFSATLEVDGAVTDNNS